MISLFFHSFLRSQSTSCCKFLKLSEKSFSKKSENEIDLAFLSVEGKTNTLHVNINFTENSLFGIGRYCGKVFPEPTDFHLF